MRIRNPITGRVVIRKLRRTLPADRFPHELTFSCYYGYRFLQKDRTCHWFVEALESARQKWPVDLWAWVLMPEHVHLLLSPRETGVKMGRVRGFIKERVARQAIVWLEENAPEWIAKITVREGTRLRRRFWQPGGGFDRTVEQVETLYQMIEYIHLNPVRRGLVKRPEDWEWSSARWYAGQPAHIEMDRTLPMLEE